MSDLVVINSGLKRLIQDKMQGPNPEIKKCYQLTINKFLEDAGNDFNFATVEQYIQNLRNRGLRTKSVDVYISALKNMMRAIFDNPELTVLQKYQLEKTLSHIKVSKKNKGDDAVTTSQLISAEELEILKSKAPEKIGLLMEFLFHTGCRISEALNIRIADIKQTSDKVYSFPVIGKGNKERTLRASIQLIEAIQAEFQGSTLLFEAEYFDRVNLCNKFTRLGRRYLNRKITPHMFRHSFATRKIKETHKLAAVSHFLGHQSVSTTTDYYLHEVLDDDELL